MHIHETLIETPTISRLRRERFKRDYFFILQEKEIQSMRKADLPPAAVLAFMAIRGAAWASGEGWAALPRKTLEMFNFPQAWWRLNVRRLEVAGLIECSREPGQLRRYRLTDSSGEQPRKSE